MSVVEGLPDPIVDVGSGNGSPGIPVAHALPARKVILLEAESRRCDFLRAWAPPNASVIWGRAEEQETDWAGRPSRRRSRRRRLRRSGACRSSGPAARALLWVGESADLDQLARVAAKLGAEPEETPAGLALLRKVGPTPSGFPRRPGIARKRPLG